MNVKQKLKKFFFPTRYKLKQLTKQIEDMKGDVETNCRQVMSLAEMKYHVSLPTIPPKHLQVRVAGSYYGEFFENGRSMFRDIQEILGKHGLDMLAFGKVLDFGCGCGRTLIPLSLLANPLKLSGTDIDAETIAWLKGNYSCFNDLDVNGHAPPTKYKTGEFDFIYSISIFTHLPEDMQCAWLKELSRIIKPGGHGIFSTHGKNHFGHLRSGDLGTLSEKGFCYSDFGSTEGLPDFYKTSFQTPDYIKREWARYFDVLAVYEQNIGQHQDAVLVRKRPD